MKYDFQNLSATDLRQLADDFCEAAKIADQIHKIFGQEVRIDATSSPTLGLPIFGVRDEEPLTSGALERALKGLEALVDEMPDAPSATPSQPSPTIIATAWTDEEDQALLNAVRKYPTTANIRLGAIVEKDLPRRTAKSCEQRLGSKKLRDQVAQIRKGAAAKADGESQPVPAETLPAAKAEVAAAQPTPTAPANLSYDDRELYRYLSDVTAAGPTPNFDIPMIEAVGRGTTLAHFSASADLPHGIVTQRFNKLVASLRKDSGLLPIDAMGRILKILKIIHGAA